MARKLFGVVAAVALASGAMFALVGPASADVQQGPNTLNIQKSVVGVAPSGTVFSVQVSCSASSLPTNTQTVWFDHTGHASDAAGNQISAPVLHPRLSDVCTVSETNSGGASSVSYACSASGGTDNRTTCNGGHEVDYVDTDMGVGTITVTNTFNESTTTTTATTLPPAVTTLPPTTTVAPKPVPKPVVAPAKFTG